MFNRVFFLFLISFQLFLEFLEISASILDLSQKFIFETYPQIADYYSLLANS